MDVTARGAYEARSCCSPTCLQHNYAADDALPHAIPTQSLNPKQAGLGAQEGHLAHEAHRHHEPLAGAAAPGMTGAAGPGMAGVSGGEMPLGGVEGVEGARGMGMGGTSGGMGEAGMGGAREAGVGGMGGMGAAPVEMATERTTERTAERGAATGAGGGLEGGLGGERAPVMGEEAVRSYRERDAAGNGEAQPDWFGRWEEGLGRAGSSRANFDNHTHHHHHHT